MRFYCVFKIQKFIHSIEYHLFKIFFLFTMSSGKFEFLSSAQSVWFLEDLCCLYFFSKLLKDQIITCIRRNERNYNNSGISASKVSLTIVYLRRTKVHNKLHNYYKWTIRKITHLKLFDTLQINSIYYICSSHYWYTRVIQKLTQCRQYHDKKGIPSQTDWFASSNYSSCICTNN